ncbi:MAG TPA: hypothetical protein VIH06_13430, partial [Ilumatobacteraceae bacterium]
MVSLAWVHAREVGGVCSAEPGADVNGDGCVDVSDLQAVASTTDTTVATAPRNGATTTAVPSIQAAAVPGTGQQFVVDTDSDLPDTSIGNGICATSAGTCSLRAAVQEANAINGANSIVFNIPGAGVHTIRPTTSLNITDATGGVTIDGYSQPGATANTDPLASNAQIKVEIRGDGTSTAVGTFDGIRVVSANNTLRGIAVYNANDQVHLVGSAANHNRIIGDFIGTNAAATSTSPLGAFASSGGNGLHLESGSHDNVFRTPDLADRNVFDGAPYAGIRIDHVHSNANIIQNNIFGLTPNGGGKLPNRRIAIDLQWGASHNKIGGLGPHERNVMSGQSYDAVDLSHSTATSFNEVVGNFIGTTLDGESVTSYTRTFYGIAFKDDIANNLVHDNVIGGANEYPIWHKHDYTGHNDIYDNRIGVSLGGRPLANSKFGMFMQGHDFTVRNNIFANSASGGIFLTSDISDRDTFTGNTFFNNGGLAIDLAPAGPTANGSVGHTGPNSNLNYPVLRTVTTTSAAGTACANCRVELYRSTPDTGNRGEGNLLLGTAVAGPGGVFATTLTGAATADLVAAIAIDPTGNTSEFSTVVKATGVTPPPTTPPPTAPPTVPTPPVASLPPTADKFVPLQPARLLDTRPGATTIDNQDAATGIVGTGNTYQLTIAGRGGVPLTATAAVLNVTATEATGPGFVTVYPCGSP